MSVEEAARLGERLADALQYAHHHGVLHFDVKPANVLCEQTGEDSVPKLADLGLARFIINHSGSVSEFTPGYAAPEQFARQTFGDHNPDYRTDLYQLGIVLYELFTGNHPFPDRKGGRGMVTESQLRRKPDVPSDVNDAVPSAVDDLLLKLLKPDPPMRPDAAVEVKRVLTDVLLTEDDAPSEAVDTMRDATPEIYLPMSIADRLLLARNDSVRRCRNITREVYRVVNQDSTVQSDDAYEEVCERLDNLTETLRGAEMTDGDQSVRPDSDLWHKIERTSFTVIQLYARTSYFSQGKSN